MANMKEIQSLGCPTGRKKRDFTPLNMLVYSPENEHVPENQWWEDVFFLLKKSLFGGHSLVFGGVTLSKDASFKNKQTILPVGKALVAFYGPGGPDQFSGNFPETVVRLAVSKWCFEFTVFICCL